MNPNQANETSMIATIRGKVQVIEVKIKKVEDHITTLDQWNEVKRNLAEYTEQLNAQIKIVNDTLEYVKKVDKEFNSKRMDYLELIRQEIEKNIRPLIRGPTSLSVAECRELELKLKRLGDRLNDTNTDDDDGLRQVKNDLDHELARLEDDLEHMNERAHHNEGRTGREHHQ